MKVGRLGPTIHHAELDDPWFRDTLGLNGKAEVFPLCALMPIRCNSISDERRAITPISAAINKTAADESSLTG